MKIYIVTGTSGSYEQQIQWNVCAFTSEAEANERIYKIRTKMIEFGFAFNNEDYFSIPYHQMQSKIDEFKNDPDCDPDFDYCYTGTDYEVNELELVGL